MTKKTSTPRKPSAKAGNPAWKAPATARSPSMSARLATGCRSHRCTCSFDRVAPVRQISHYTRKRRIGQNACVAVFLDPHSDKTDPSVKYRMWRTIRPIVLSRYTGSVGL
jgi:hypothetical protein